ncbi:uncharacterized protein BXZ73DRAFT_102652 [Epithele typhae]|uniref:uncharacterized protein n=1 Tax=Epithele typhae TaxID=378194 RepID=UPI0020076DD9|nr:uncharacterized protein BXZ73DRAFT_102652 [Epithele typhae]KAH9927522.1 hypothetical protein BXZ73DRAFT_102652 [Epithele typhae]
MLDHAAQCTKGVPLKFFYDQKLLVAPTTQELAGLFPETDISEISKRFRAALKVKNGKEIGNIVETDVSRVWAELDEAHHLCPDHTFQLSQCKADKNESKVDGGFFHQNDKEFLLPDCPNWEYQRYTVEFKRGGNGLDPFSDDNDIEPNADKRRAARHQLYAYASCVFDVQHRTALYMLFVNRSKFRLLRWDRSGVIVSEATDYATSKAKTKILLKVLVSLARMQDDKAAPDNMSVLQKAGVLTVGAEAAGFDPTAQRLSPNSCGWARMDQLAQVEADFDVDEYNTEDHVTSELPTEFRDNERSACSPFTPTGSHPDPLATMEETAGDAWPKHLKRRTFNYIRQRFVHSLKQSNVRYVLVIDNKFYLVGRAIFCADNGPIGRGTRGWIALEWHTQRFVFVKDAWQPHCVDADPEHVMLKKLNDEKVPHVPTLVAAESYAGQVTYFSVIAGTAMPAVAQTAPSPTNGSPVSPTASSDADPVGIYSPHVVNLPAVTNATLASADLATGTEQVDRQQQDEPKEPVLEGVRQHVRMVVDEVCLPLKEFPCGVYLVRAILHAIVGEFCAVFLLWQQHADEIIAHKTAVNKCHLLHRDVSAGNILLLLRFEHNESEGTSWIEWDGILADWEMARSTEAAVGPRVPPRTGTWPFMSILWQKDPTRVIGIDDELESFMHVLIFESVIFMTHNWDWDMEFLRMFIDQYFHQTLRMSCGDCTCSEYRDRCIHNGTLTLGGMKLEFHALGNSGKKFPGHPLNELLRWLLQRFSARLLVHEWEHRTARTSSTAVAAPIDVPMARRPKNKARIAATPSTSTAIVDSERGGPDGDMKAKADSLKTHDAVIAKFEAFLDLGWPLLDKAVERFAPPAEPQAGNKRMRDPGNKEEISDARPSKKSKRSHKEPKVGLRRSARIAIRKRSGRPAS